MLSSQIFSFLSLSSSLSDLVIFSEINQTQKPSTEAAPLAFPLSLSETSLINPSLEPASRNPLPQFQVSMATLSIGRSFHTKQGRLPRRKPWRNPTTSVSCQGRDPTGSPDSDEKRKGKQIKPWILRPYAELEKLGKYLKDNLSPKQKGDWKDLLLVSFSFAVYVYISQQLVCAYFAHVSMLKQFQ